MKRGDIISVSLPRDYGKPRPAIVIQSDFFEHIHSVAVLPLTSEIIDGEICRITIEASPETGLRKTSQVMVDKISSVPRIKAGTVIGRISGDDMTAVNRALALFVGFG